MTKVPESSSTPKGPLRKGWTYVGRSEEPLPNCDRPRVLMSPDYERVLTRCGASSRNKCVPCAQTYRQRVRRIFHSGWQDRPIDRVYLVTLTAPGESVHYLPNGEACPCTPDGGVSLARWNSELGQSWTHLLEYLRREFGEIEYAKGTEPQVRGALHLHVLLRCNADLIARKVAVRRLAMRWGFGHSVDIKAVDSSSKRAASYVAKYVSKSADEDIAVPWVDRQTGEIVNGARCRRWTSSRSWGLTMRQLRQAQADHARAAVECGVSRADDAGRGPCGGAAVALDSNPESYTDHPVSSLVDKFSSLLPSPM